MASRCGREDQPGSIRIRWKAVCGDVRLKRSRKKREANLRPQEYELAVRPGAGGKLDRNSEVLLARSPWRTRPYAGPSGRSQKFKIYFRTHLSDFQGSQRSIRTPVDRKSRRRFSMSLTTNRTTINRENAQH